MLKHQTSQNYTNTEVKAFLEDILVDSTNKYLGYNASKIDIGIVKAWKLLYDAKGTLKYKTDFVLLKQVAKMQNNTNLLERLGGREGLVDIIRKNEFAPCYTCSNNKDYLEKMDEYLQSVEYFANTFHNTTDFGKVFSKGIVSGNKGQRAGAIFMLKVLNRDKSIRPTGFERSYPKVGTVAGCEADAIMGSKIYEFKSWSPRGDEDEEDEEQKYDKSKSSFWNFERGYQSYGQFLCYLRNITTLDDLEYVFDKDNIEKNGEANAENYVKLRFQKLFQNKVTEIWNIIVTKPQILTDLGNLTVNDFDDFEVLVNKLDNRLFGFIKVK